MYGSPYTVHIFLSRISKSTVSKALLRSSMQQNVVSLEIKPVQTLLFSSYEVNEENREFKYVLFYTFFPVDIIIHFYVARCRGLVPGWLVTW